MKAKYQKYYDALKGKDFAGPVGGYKSSLSDATAKLGSVESLISSSTWTEKGVETVKGSVIPTLKETASKIENSLGVLSEVASKVNELVNQLEALKNLEETLESLGSRWSYSEGGSRSQSEVNAHNNKIAETEKKITEQESAIDGTIAAINGISVESVDVAASGTTPVAEDDASSKDDNVDPNSLAAKRKKFIGSMDDDCYNYTDPNYVRKARTLTLFDNTTGEILGEGDSITIKKGERRVITVKLPTDSGHIDEIVRTSAWKPEGCTVLNTYSDVNPDPDKVEYVNFHNNHWPEDKSVLHSNYYEWIIEGTETGSVQISQTCLFKREEGGPCPKAMVDIHVNVVN